MRVAQLSWSETTGWASASGNLTNTTDADLVFFFGARQALASGERYRELRAMFPDAHILGCSTGGQIHNGDVTDDEIAASAIRFDWDQIACRQRGGAVAGKLARMWQKNRPRVGGVRPCRHFRSFRWPQCQWQRTRRGHCRRRRRTSVGHRRVGRRWRRFCGDARGRRLRAAQTSCRGGWLLWSQRSASATAVPVVGTSSARGVALPGLAAMCCSSSMASRRWTFMSDIWARRRRGVFLDPDCYSRFAFSIRSGRIMTSLGRFLPWIARRGP